MIFHAPHLLLAFRWLVPAVGIFGNATNHLTVQALYRLLTLPFPASFVWKYHRKLFTHYNAMISFFYETWSGVQFQFYGDPYTFKPENVIYISNHQCTVDWVIADSLCIKQSGVGGRVKYMLKDVIKYIPMYGWQLGDVGGIYVKRGGKQNKDSVSKKLLWLKNNNIPMWLVIFPEGTRYNPKDDDKIRRCWEHCDSKGIERLNNVLAPRTAGFEMSVDALRSYVDAVYDITVVYEGRDGHSIRSPSPDLFGFFSGTCRKVHIDFRRIPIDKIPSDSDGQKQWLYNSFKRKDKLIGEFISTGRIPSPSQSLPLPILYTLPPTLVYIAALIVIMGTARGRQWNLGLTVFFSFLGFIFVQRM